MYGDNEFNDDHHVTLIMIIIALPLNSGLYTYSYSILGNNNRFDIISEQSDQSLWKSPNSYS